MIQRGRQRREKRCACEACGAVYALGFTHKQNHGPRPFALWRFYLRGSLLLPSLKSMYFELLLLCELVVSLCEN